MNRGLMVCILLMSFGATAVPELCLQLPKRIEACPNLLYKKSNIAVPALQVKKGQVICLCLSDLVLLQEANPSALEKIDQQVDWADLSRHYQLQQHQILALLRE